MRDNLVESWKKQIQWYSDDNCFSELKRIDGQLMDFEWKIFPGFNTVAILNEIQQMMGELQCEPENFTGRIIFMSMFNDFVWDAKGMMNYAWIIQRPLKSMLKDSLAVIGLASGLDLKRSGAEPTIANQMGRQNNVTKLIKMFEKHQHEDQFLNDMSQKQEIHRFSEETQKLLVDMNRTEIFLCENFAKLECPYCNAFSEIGIIHNSCGRNLKYSRSPTTTQKANQDFTSIPGFVIKKISSRGPKHGASERQIMFFKAKEMLKKAREPEHGGHPTILARWYAQKGYRNSLAKHNIGEKMLYYRIALERHDYGATRAERVQNANHWVLRLNAVRLQKPLRQRPEFAVAFKQCFKIQDAHLEETQQSLRPIRPEHQQRQRPNQQFEGGEKSDCHVDRKTGWRYHREPRRNPQAASSSSTSQWPTSQWQTMWSSWQPASSDHWWWFRFPGKNSWKSTVGVDRTPTHKTHLCCTVCSQARTAQPMNLAQKLHCHLLCLIRVQSSGAWHVSPMVVLSRALLHEHFLFFTTYPTIQREHSVHPAHLQASSVDKLRHQESLWREDLQSGGKPRTKTPTQLETVMELYDMDIHQKISVPNCQNWRQWWRGVWIRNFDYETLTPDTGKSKQDQWSRVERAQVALK